MAMYTFYKQKFARTRNPELVTEISIMHSKDTLNKPLFIEVSAFQHLQLINNSGQFFFFTYTVFLAFHSNHQRSEYKCKNRKKTCMFALFPSCVTLSLNKGHVLKKCCRPCFPSFFHFTARE